MEIELDDIRELYRNEGKLIRERIRLFLTFEGFLFAAVAFSVKDGLLEIALLLALLGTFSCIPIYYTTVRSFAAAGALHDLYNSKAGIVETDGWVPTLSAYDASTKRELLLLPEVFLPIALGVAWVILLILLSLRLS